MARVHVFLHDTYADWEIGYVLPELARSGHEVVTFGLTAAPVRSMGCLRVSPDLAIEAVRDPAMLILPGGLFWAGFEDARLDRLVRELRDAGGTIAAICGATGYLARLGLLDGVAHTSNSCAFLRERAPGYAGAARYLSVPAVADRKIITASGLGAIDFTYEILREVGYPDLGAWYRAFAHFEEPGADSRYFAIVLSKVPGHDTGRESVERHIEHLRKLDEEGRLVLGGPFLDHPSGLVVVKAADHAEATRIAEADPFVVDGVRTFEVRTWLLAHRENGYLGSS